MVHYTQGTSEQVMTTATVEVITDFSARDEVIRRSHRVARASHWSLGASLGTLYLLPPQRLAARHEQVRQRAGHNEPMPVLPQAPVADLGEAEHSFDHADRMLHLGADARLATIRVSLLARRG